RGRGPAAGVLAAGGPGPGEPGGPAAGQVARPDQGADRGGRPGGRDRGAAGGRRTMKTEITFLQELEDDLQEAARREIEGVPGEPSTARPDGRPGRVREPRRRRPDAKVLALAAACFVLLAGIVGYVATRGGGLGTRQTQASLRTEPRIAVGQPYGPFSQQFAPQHPAAMPSAARADAGAGPG